MAQHDAAVLILGETGTGKELFARAIHYQSHRKEKPFIPVNCGALPDHLFENELFGHAKGAYTDAASEQKGLLQEAEGGTLFLDEIDALSASGQIKLLRFLQDREYRPLGSSKSLIANVRILAATNRDLKILIQQKMFREDLYYRLNIFSTSIPPLQDHSEDIPHLAKHFVSHFARQYGRQDITLSGEALDKLSAYNWPGNVRELESVIQRAIALSASPSLQPNSIDIPSPDQDVSTISSTLSQAKSAAVQRFELVFLRFRGQVS